MLVVVVTSYIQSSLFLLFLHGIHSRSKTCNNLMCPDQVVVIRMAGLRVFQQVYYKKVRWNSFERLDGDIYPLAVIHNERHAEPG